MTATGGKHTPNVVTWQTLELFNQTGKKNFGFFFYRRFQLYNMYKKGFIKTLIFVSTENIKNISESALRKLLSRALVSSQQ